MLVDQALSNLLDRLARLMLQMDFIDDNDPQLQYNPPVPPATREPIVEYFLKNKWTEQGTFPRNQTITVSFTST